MPKKKQVKFNLGDAPKPTRGPGGVFNLRSPVALKLASKAEVRLNLGVSCEHPLHLFEVRGLRERNVRLPDGIWACADAGTQLTVVLKNESDTVQMIEVGDTVARAAVLDNTNYEIAE